MFRAWSKMKPFTLVDKNDSKEKNPVRKCPFLYPLIHKDSKGLPINIFYDCIRHECQIWDGVNCSLHHERKS